MAGKQYVPLNGASQTAVVFKALAVLILAGGVIGAIGAGTSAHDAAIAAGRDSGGDVAVAVAVVVGSAVVSASFLAFFGYVLDLLCGIYIATVGDADSTVVAGRPTGRPRPARPVAPPLKPRTIVVSIAGVLVLSVLSVWITLMIAR